MKKLYKNIRARLFLGLLALTLAIFPASSQAGEGITLEKFKGHVFVIVDGQASDVRFGQRIPDLAELMTEEGGQATLRDSAGHLFHLAGSAHVKLINKIVELRRGYLWVQSSTSWEGYSIQTANAQVNYTQAEGIVSFDPESGRSQILTVRGSLDVANIMEKDIMVKVADGHFTLIDQKYENGIPRTPTPVGFDSFKKVTRLFHGVSSSEATAPAILEEKKAAVASAAPVKAEKSTSRMPASVSETTEKEGTIIYYLRDHKKEKEEQDKKVKSFYGQKIERMIAAAPKVKKFKPDYNKRSDVELKIWAPVAPAVVAQKGIEPSPAIVVQKVEPATAPAADKPQRAPASIQEAPELPVNDKAQDIKLEEFTKEMRMNNEASNLIKDLESFRQDVQSEF